MRGVGSRNQRKGATKRSTEDFQTIDVRCWHRTGLLVPNQSFAWHWWGNGVVMAAIQVHAESDRLVLNYRHRLFRENWRAASYPVYLSWTTCNFGGQRPWFLCPVRGCGRRVAILYAGAIFACRHCHQLAYRSQHETDGDRARRRADRIRVRLGWQPGILNGHGCKPKGMHWKTFRGLVKQHEELVQLALSGLRLQLEPSEQETERLT